MAPDAIATVARVTDTLVAARIGHRKFLFLRTVEPNLENAMAEDPGIDDSTQQWLEAELEDILDEDVEMENSEPALSMELRKIYRKQHPKSMARAAFAGRW